MSLFGLFDQEFTLANFLLGLGIILGPIILAATAVTVVLGVGRIIIMPMVAKGGMTRSERTGRASQAKWLARLLFGLGLILAGFTAFNFDVWSAAITIVALGVGAWLYRVARVEGQALLASQSSGGASD